MRKIILSLICALVILSACEKVVLNDPSTNLPNTSTNKTSPTVTLTDPANNATGVVLNHIIVTNFNKPIDQTTITSLTFTLMQGLTAVAGTITSTGTKATFTSTSNLSPNTIYTGTITTGAKDVAGNALISNYTFSFTTGTAADTIPPTVISTDPLNNATSVATNKVVALTFSEAMDPLTLNTTTFTLKQGTTSVSGTVAYSGTNATFTPSNILAPGTTYTATITTGAKDIAGNALAANSVWSFTTFVTPPLSFASDVVPVLTMCNNCHRHGWTTSSVASTFYTNLVNRGYVNPISYTSSMIYSMLNSGHPGSGNISTANTNKIINWMKEGSKNN